MSSVDIKRGDAYFIKIALKINDELLTADDFSLIHCVEFTLGTDDKKRKLYPDDVGFADGVFLYPLSQEETFAFKEGKTIPIDIRVHFKNGNVAGTHDMINLKILKSLSEVIL